MRFRVTKKHIIEIILPAVAVTVLGIGFLVGMYVMRPTLITTTEKLSNVSSRVATLEERLIFLTGDAELLRTNVAQGDEDRAKEQILLQEKLGTLSGNLDVQGTQIKEIVETTDVSGLVTQWGMFVYRMTCSFKNIDTRETQTSKGSAVLEQMSTGIRFITNKHVLQMDSARLTKCTLSTLEGDVEIVIDDSEVVVSEDIDFGYGYIKESFPAMLSLQQCAEKPSIGDTVLILGYPVIGAKESVTATEGIISGFDEEYYTTSAKIEKGNSGGAAIDVKHNCFLGLPTLVFSGKIESLARILPATSF
ncbi:MAG: serine protease [Candidatus Campbellbacteria bacterium]|nr:serine protease [Candidatus Campbellbacteria bacterium]